MAKDPVCSMTVDEKTAKFKTVHMGKTYYFCSPGDKATFDKNPMKFVGGHTGHSEHSGHSGHRGCCG